MSQLMCFCTHTGYIYFRPVPEEDSSCFYISSVTGEGLEDLRDEIQNRLLRNMGYLVKKIRVPLSGPHLKLVQ